MYLVIVESPAKARTIGKLLGRKYRVKASMGHLVDLPRSQLGIDKQNDFEPKYITIRGKGKILKELKEARKKASHVYLATDPDREGEAISWHLSSALKLDSDKASRVEFNEITKKAVREAFSNPRYLDVNKFEAQQARRVLDRLVGYMISPLLWERVRKGLSAGRVQSVAVRLICDREKEIESFVPQEYWSIEGFFKEAAGSTFTAKFYGLKDKKISLSSEGETEEVLKKLRGNRAQVNRVNRRERRRNPAPPFTTSTLQQEAFRRLGFTTKRTMRAAQQLYEGIEVGPKKESIGLITYMRTDAARVSPAAQEEATDFIKERFGEQYLPPSARKYSARKGAQEAHEAIRPTSVFREPDSIKKSLGRDQYRLYKLIWERFLASQMESALVEQVRVDIMSGDYMFKANGSTTTFAGFTVVYDPGSDKRKDNPLPPLQEGQELELVSLKPAQHFTQPPPRYSEASLVKTMENRGIGRPSTYSPTIETIQSRGYVVKEEKVLRPTELGFVIADLMKDYFPEIIDIDFTAQLEDKLDKIEAGGLSWLGVINEFYEPFKDRLEVAREKMAKVHIVDEETEETCPLCGKNLVKKFGRYGEFLACPGFPECRYTKQPGVDTGVECPLCGEGSIVERRSKKGRKFYGCSNYPGCEFAVWDKPAGKNCPDCGYLMVEKKSREGLFYRCGSKSCQHREEVMLTGSEGGSSGR